MRLIVEIRLHAATSARTRPATLRQSRRISRVAGVGIRLVDGHPLAGNSPAPNQLVDPLRLIALLLPLPRAVNSLHGLPSGRRLWRSAQRARRGFE